MLLALIIFNDNKIINDNINKAKCSNKDGTNNNNDINNSIINEKL